MNVTYDSDTLGIEKSIDDGSDWEFHFAIETMIYESLPFYEY
jgi:hypothetical protein